MPTIFSRLSLDLARSAEGGKELKELAKSKGRNAGVITASHAICRETEEEATVQRDRMMGDLADWESVDNLVNLQFAHAQSFPHDLLQQFRNVFMFGHCGFPLVGTPCQVADGMISLHESGFSGTILSFVDYVASSHTSAARFFHY